MKTMKATSKSNSSGFTLIELIITIAIMAILVSWAFPSLRESIKNNQMAAQNNEMVAMLHYARSEAIRRNADIEVHFGTEGDGWQAYIAQPGVYETGDGCETGQLRCSSNTETSLITGDTTMITFNNRGYIRSADDSWASETFFMQHSNCKGQSQRRRIDIMPTGQISSCHLACGSLDAC